MADGVQTVERTALEKSLSRSNGCAERGEEEDGGVVRGRRKAARFAEETADGASRLPPDVRPGSKQQPGAVVIVAPGREEAARRRRCRRARRRE